MEKEFNDEGEKGIDDLIENIKKKRNVKLFNQEEINFINDYNNHNYNLDEEEEKIQKFIFNPKKVNLKES
jgi:hypothetical protein